MKPNSVMILPCLSLLMATIACDIQMSVQELVDVATPGPHNICNYNGTMILCVDPDSQLPFEYIMEPEYYEGEADMVAAVASTRYLYGAGYNRPNGCVSMNLLIFQI